LRFDAYTKKVVIDGQEYEIRPLSGRFFPKLYSVVSAFEKAKKSGSDDSNIIDFLDESVLLSVHELCLETFKKSYPSESVDKLDDFVSQNLWEVFGAVTQVNFKNKE